MKVCIAEKPGVAKEIAAVIGAGRRMDGYFEGNGFQVTWTFGHLCTLKEPHDYSDKWKIWDMRMLPMLPKRFGIKLINDKGVKKQFEIIGKLLERAEEVINCGDAGQEGELIQRWVLSKAGNNKPLKRLWISSLTEEAIKDGFDHLHDGHEFDNLYAAGSARAIGDWLLGMNATRLYTLKYGRNRQVLSIGRVQTPALSIIVARQLEINGFKPEQYWELKTKYRDTVFGAFTGRFVSKEDALVTLSEITGHEFYIISYETKTGYETPPRLFDLTSLQVDCNRIFGFTAEHTLRLIQSLYEKKLTTYPRVDTTYLSEDIYPKVPGILSKLTPYQEFVKPLLTAGIRKSSKIFDDKKITDHHAIIPTGMLSDSITPEERKVYEMVVRRFIGAFYADCKVAMITVLGDVNKVEFKASGKQILEPGWRLVCKVDDEKVPAEEKLLPVFNKGEHGQHEPEVTQKMTQPPKYYTEATLLRAMETAGKSVDDEELREVLKQNGIGRPSTRAGIIETLFRRKYIYRDNKKIVANPTGIELIGTIENELLKSAALTGIWEKKLREIEAGRYKISTFMAELKEMVSEIVQQVKQSAGNEFKVIEPDDKMIIENAGKSENNSKSIPSKGEPEKIICPKCKKGLIIKGNKAWGCARFLDGCHLRVPFVFMGKVLSVSHMEQLIRKGKTRSINGFTDGTEVKRNGKLLFDKEFNIILE